MNEETQSNPIEENTPDLNSPIQNNTPVPVTSQQQLSNLDMMKEIAANRQTLNDIKSLTSSKVTDQLKVFLISQARNELSRVIKLTEFLDKLESKFIDKVTDDMTTDALTLKQYSDVIELITSLLTRSNNIVSQVLKDDSLMTILNTTIYTTSDQNNMQATAIVASLKDPQSRERVRSVLRQVLSATAQYSQNVIEVDPQNIEEVGDNNG